MFVYIRFEFNGIWGVSCASAVRCERWLGENARDFEIMILIIILPLNFPTQFHAYKNILECYKVKILVYVRYPFDLNKYENSST